MKLNPSKKPLGILNKIVAFNIKQFIKNNGNFVVATHFYHLYDNSNLHTMLKDIVELAKELAPNQVEFVSAENLF